MTAKILGVILVITGCGGLGFLIAAAHKKEIKTLKQLISALDYMECELQYRMLPLPELCRQVSNMQTGHLRTVFLQLAQEMDNQVSPNVEKCMYAALEKFRDIPCHTRKILEQLGSSLGCFDISGQLKGLDAIRNESKQVLKLCSENQDVRLRSYKTLGICAGAAVAILLV